MYAPKHFKIAQRLMVLNSGLLDRSQLVRKCVTNVFLPKWLASYERSYYELLKGIRLDSNMEKLMESIKVSELVLKIFLQSKPIVEMIEVLQLDENKLLKIDQIAHESILYWRVLVKFIVDQGDAAEEFLESVLPSLIHFCDYIKNFVKSNKNKELEKWEENIYQSILMQLFQMIDECFDLSDEAGRSHLQQLIKDILLKEKLYEHVVLKIVVVFEKIALNCDQFISGLLEIVSDVTEPVEMEQCVLNADQKRRLDVQIGQLRLKINLLTDDEEQAVKDKDYEKAGQINTEIANIRTQITELQAKFQPPVEVRKKSDSSEDIIKAFDIIIAMLFSTNVKVFTTQLRSLYENFIMEYCGQQSNSSPIIESKALRSLTMCAYLDQEIALLTMARIYYRLMAYKFNLITNKQVVIQSLKSSCDLLLLYGLSQFSKETEPTSENDNNKNAKNVNKTKRTLYDSSQMDTTVGNISDDIQDEDDDVIPNSIEQLNISSSSHDIIECITSLLDDEDETIRTLAANGLIRLLCSGKLKSANILSRLIILWFNPVTDNDTELRQIIAVMLQYYAREVPGSSEEFEKSFFLTLNTIFGAPVASPLKKIDIDKVINFILTYSSPGFNKHEIVNTHNHLAIMLCEKILENPDSSDSFYYIKCLPGVLVSNDDDNLKRDLTNICNQIIENLSAKLLKRYIEKFLKQMNEAPVVIDQTTEDDEDNNSQNTNSANDINDRRSSSGINLNKSLRVNLTRLSLIEERLEENEDNVPIDDSSSAGSSSKNKAENVIISTSESENSEVSSTSESELEEAHEKSTSYRSLRSRSTLSKTK